MYVEWLKDEHVIKIAVDDVTSDLSIYENPYVTTESSVRIYTSRIADLIDFFQASNKWYESIHEKDAVYAPWNSKMHAVFENLTKKFNTYSPFTENKVQDEVSEVDLTRKFTCNIPGTSVLIAKKDKIIIARRPGRAILLSIDTLPIDNIQREEFFRDTKAAPSFTGKYEILARDKEYYGKWSSIMYQAYLAEVEKQKHIHIGEEDA